MKRFLFTAALLFAVVAYPSELRKYAVQTAIRFPLIDVAGVNLATTAACASGDATISKDGGAFTTTTNCFTAVGSSSGYYSLTLTASEMTAANIAVKIVDQTTTKVWLDDGFTIDTCGSAAAQFSPDCDSEAFRISQSSMIPGTVSASAFTPTTTQFEAADITIATTSRVVGRIVCFASSSSLYGECRAITAYTLSGGRGHFTVGTLTAAPQDGDAFVVL